MFIASNKIDRLVFFRYLHGRFFLRKQYYEINVLKNLLSLSSVLSDMVLLVISYSQWGSHKYNSACLEV